MVNAALFPVFSALLSHLRGRRSARSACRSPSYSARQRHSTHHEPHSGSSFRRGIGALLLGSKVSPGDMGTSCAICSLGVQLFPSCVRSTELRRYLSPGAISRVTAMVADDETHPSRPRLDREQKRGTIPWSGMRRARPVTSERDAWSKDLPTMRSLTRASCAGGKGSVKVDLHHTT